MDLNNACSGKTGDGELTTGTQAGQANKAPHRGQSGAKVANPNFSEVRRRSDFFRRQAGCRFGAQRGATRDHAWRDQGCLAQEYGQPENLSPVCPDQVHGFLRAHPRNALSCNESLEHARRIVGCSFGFAKGNPGFALVILEPVMIIAPGAGSCSAVLRKVREPRN